MIYLFAFLTYILPIQTHQIPPARALVPRPFKIVFKSLVNNPSLQKYFQISHKIVAEYFAKLLTIEPNSLTLVENDCTKSSIPKSDINVAVDADLVIYTISEYSVDQYLVKSQSCQMISQTVARTSFSIIRFNQAWLTESQFKQAWFMQYMHRIMMHKVFHLLGLRTKQFPFYKEKNFYDDKLFINLQSIQIQAQKFYGCKTGLPFFQDNWIQLFMGDQILTPYFSKSESMYVSIFTLLLLKATGYYTSVDLSMNQQEKAVLGKNQGCRLFKQYTLMNIIQCSEGDYTLNMRMTGYGICSLSRSYQRLHVDVGNTNCLSQSYSGFYGDLSFTLQESGPLSMAYNASVSRLSPLPYGVRCFKSYCGVNGLIQVEINKTRYVCDDFKFISSPNFNGFVDCPQNISTLCQTRMACPQGCPNSLCFNGKCVASTSCLQDQFLDGSNCVLLCPAGKYGYKGNCIQTCPANLFLDQVIRRCVETCPYQFSADSDRVCIETCQQGQIFEVNACKKICPNNLYDSVSKKCVQQCQNFIVDGVCKPNKPTCSKYTTYPQSSCVDFCYFFVNQTKDTKSCYKTCQKNHCADGCQPHKCVQNCPNGLVQHNMLNICSKNCLPIYPYQHNNLCLQACPMKLYNNLAQKKCVEKCPPSTKLYPVNNTCLVCQKLIFKNLCVTQCPSRYIMMKDFCIPQYCQQFGVRQGVCRPCIRGEFKTTIDNITFCTSECSMLKIFIDNKFYCSQQCPPSLVQSNGFCVQKMPGNNLALAIALPITLTLLLVGLGLGWYYWKKRRASQPQQTANKEQQVQLQSNKDIMVLASQISEKDQNCHVCFQPCNLPRDNGRCSECFKTVHNNCLNQEGVCKGCDPQFKQ